MHGLLSSPGQHRCVSSCVIACLYAFVCPLLCQGTAGQKRSKPSSSFTPVTRQPANLSASCLATLCMAIVDDGLLPLPSNYDITLPNWHMQLARDHAFRSFVLRSCSNLLEGAQSAAAATAMLQLESPSGPASAAAAASGDGSRSGAGAPVAPAADEVLVLGPALFQVIKVMCCAQRSRSV